MGRTKRPAADWTRVHSVEEAMFSRKEGLRAASHSLPAVDRHRGSKRPSTSLARYDSIGQSKHLAAYPTRNSASSPHVHFSGQRGEQQVRGSTRDGGGGLDTYRHEFHPASSAENLSLQLSRLEDRLMAMEERSRSTDVQQSMPNERRQSVNSSFSGTPTNAEKRRRLSQLQLPEGPASEVLPQKLKASVTELQGRIQSLMFVYNGASQAEEWAAVIVGKCWRRYHRRKLYKEGLQALRSWQAERSEPVCEIMGYWLSQREIVHRQARELAARTIQGGLARYYFEWKNQMQTALPTKINQRQRAYFMQLSQERIVLRASIATWRVSIKEIQHRKQVKQRNQKRMKEMMAELEEQTEEDLRSAEFLQQRLEEEWAKEAASKILSLMTSNSIHLSFHNWRRYVRHQSKQLAKSRIARRHRGSVLAKRSMSAWHEVVDRLKKRDGNRYKRRYNMRRVMMQLQEMNVKLFFLEWQRTASLRARAKKRSIGVFRGVLRAVIPAWQSCAHRLRMLRVAAVERWLHVSRYRLQSPFRAWFLWAADSRFQQKANGAVVEVMARRWLKIRQRRFLRAWASQTDTNRGAKMEREELLRMLKESTDMGKALEDSIDKYKSLYETAEAELQKRESLVRSKDQKLLECEKEISDLKFQTEGLRGEVDRLREIVDHKGPAKKFMVHAKDIKMRELSVDIPESPEEELGMHSNREVSLSAENEGISRTPLRRAVSARASNVGIISAEGDVADVADGILLVHAKRCISQLMTLTGGDGISLPSRREINSVGKKELVGILWTLLHGKASVGDQPDTSADRKVMRAVHPLDTFEIARPDRKGSLVVADTPASSKSINEIVIGLERMSSKSQLDSFENSPTLKARKNLMQRAQSFTGIKH